MFTKLKKIKLDDWDKNFLFFLFCGLLLRLVLSLFGALKLDFYTFVAWSNRLNEVGFSRFYESWSDYLPGYLYILSILSKVRTLAPSLEMIIYKLPAILADLGTGILIYKIVSGFKTKKVGFWYSLLYIFNPAIIANSTLWGQVDSLTIFFSLLAIYFLKNNYYLSLLSLAYGALVKPQAALAAPIILYIMIKNKWNLKKVIIYIILAGTVFVLGFLPFKGGQSLLPFVYERMTATMSQYPYTSVNALSFWGLGGFWQTDTLGTKIFGYLAMFVLFMISVTRIWKVKHGEYYLLANIFLLGFMFMTRMHERHLLPSLAPVLLVSSLSPVVLMSYVVISITYVLNLLYSYFWITQSFREIFTNYELSLMVLLNLASLILLLSSTWKKKIREKYLKFDKISHFKLSNLKFTSDEVVFPKIKPLKFSTKKLLYIILAFTFLSRVAFLSTPKNEYFDEVYHAFTARLMLHADPKAWEWWNPHPEGFAYEWTHPPLAKLIMAAGMLVFGENSFGWRIPGVIFGTLTVYLIYLITKEIFKDEYAGLLAAFFYSLDGLVFVMSRIGMNDTYFVFFMLLSIYLYLKDRDLLSSISFGLSLSSKWSAIYAVPIFLVIFLTLKKKIKLSYLFYFIIPPLVYVLSYTQMFTTGHTFEIFTGVQKQMWWYHTNLKATHAYTSMWWSWPLLLRPVYLYTTSEINGWVGRIYNLGNPVFFWFGLSAVFYAIYEVLISRSKRLALVIFSYLIFFVPWALSPRIMFFYHYLPSLPFLSMISAYALRKNKEFVIPVFIGAFILFIYFYPHWTGLQVPLWLDKSYYWFNSWR